MVVCSCGCSCLSICLSASLKTKLCCETSSVLELDNIRSAAILRDVLKFWSWQRQKNRICETSFKNSKVRAELTGSYHCVLRFLQSGQMAPHPPLWQTCFLTFRTATFLPFRPPASSFYFFSSLIFSLLLLYSLTLPASAFPSVHIVGSLASKLPLAILQQLRLIQLELEGLGWADHVVWQPRHGPHQPHCFIFRASAHSFWRLRLGHNGCWVGRWICAVWKPNG